MREAEPSFPHIFCVNYLLTNTALTKIDQENDPLVHFKRS
jgi:hypothetical protein